MLPGAGNLEVGRGLQCFSVGRRFKAKSPMNMSGGIVLPAGACGPWWKMMLFPRGVESGFPAVGAGPVGWGGAGSSERRVWRGREDRTQRVFKARKELSPCPRRQGLLYFQEAAPGSTPSPAAVSGPWGPLGTGDHGPSWELPAPPLPWLGGEHGCGLFPGNPWCHDLSKSFINVCVEGMSDWRAQPLQPFQVTNRETDTRERC